MENLSCPWATWEGPSLQFCEESLCAWVRTPANSWSNLAFVIVGLVIFYREKEKANKELMGYGLSTIAIGFLSFFFHASLTRLGEIGDLASMFLISVFLNRANLERVGILAESHGRLFSWIGNILSTGSLFIFKALGPPLFFVQCMVALGTEGYLYRKGRGAPNYKFLKLGFCFWIAAQTIWFLDLTRVVCNPKLHWLQGHAVWHVLMSLLSWNIYKHYALIKSASLDNPERSEKDARVAYEGDLSLESSTAKS